MDPASAKYLIQINGHLGATLLSAFPAMTWALTCWSYVSWDPKCDRHLDERE